MIFYIPIGIFWHNWIYISCYIESFHHRAVQSQGNAQQIEYCDIQNNYNSIITWHTKLISGLPTSVRTSSEKQSVWLVGWLAWRQSTTILDSVSIYNASGEIQCTIWTCTSQVKFNWITFILLEFDFEFIALRYWKILLNSEVFHTRILEIEESLTVTFGITIPEI